MIKIHRLGWCGGRGGISYVNPTPIRQRGIVERCDIRIAPVDKLMKLGDVWKMCQNINEIMERNNRIGNHHQERNVAEILWITTVIRDNRTMASSPPIVIL